jgi:hypothetical protein
MADQASGRPWRRLRNSRRNNEFEERTKGKPTPTQEENDRAKMGEHVVNKEPMAPRKAALVRRKRSRRQRDKRCQATRRSERDQSHAESGLRQASAEQPNQDRLVARPSLPEVTRRRGTAAVRVPPPRPVLTSLFKASHFTVIEGSREWARAISLHADCEWSRVRSRASHVPVRTCFRSAADGYRWRAAQLVADQGWIFSRSARARRWSKRASSAYAQTIAMCPGGHWKKNGKGGRDPMTTSALSRILKRPNFYSTILRLHDEFDAASFSRRQLVFAGDPQRPF